MERLLNKIIKEVYLNPTKDKITFVDIENSQYTYLAIGDCCSSSYIDSLDGLECLINHRINSVEHIGQIHDKEIEHEYLRQFYSFQIKTDKGLFELIYRNDSNGYYGGYLEYVYDEPAAELMVDKDFLGDDEFYIEKAKKKLYKSVLDEA